MLTKQISVFIENKKGRLAALTKVLGDNGVDLIALSIADTTNFGILRCIVSDPSKALKVLSEAGYTANTTEVLAVEVPDRPGGLADILAYLNDGEIQVEYLYSFVRTASESALILFRVDDVQRAVELLQSKGINILPEEDVYNL